MSENLRNDDVAQLDKNNNIGKHTKELSSDKKVFFSDLQISNNPSRLISILYRKGQVFKNAKLKSINLTASEQPIINLLNLDDGISQDQISKYLEIDKALTARIIQSLLSKGFIEKIRDEDDKRINRIFLTDSGRELIPPLYEVLGDWQDILTLNMTEEERSITYTCLLKMVENVQKYLNSEI